MRTLAYTLGALLVLDALPQGPKWIIALVVFFGLIYPTLYYQVATRMRDTRRIGFATDRNKIVTQNSRNVPVSNQTLKSVLASDHNTANYAGRQHHQEQPGSLRRSSRHPLASRHFRS